MNEFEGHSPGPWRMITPCDDADFIVINDSNGDMLFSCSPGTYRPMSQDYANMALAEAALELLRQRDLLLTEMRNFVRKIEKDIPVDIKTAAQWMKRAIAECEKGAE